MKTLTEHLREQLNEANDSLLDVFGISAEDTVKRLETVINTEVETVKRKINKIDDQIKKLNKEKSELENSVSLYTLRNYQNYFDGFKLFVNALSKLTFINSVVINLETLDKNATMILASIVPNMEDSVTMTKTVTNLAKRFKQNPDYVKIEDAKSYGTVLKIAIPDNKLGIHNTRLRR